MSYTKIKVSGIARTEALETFIEKKLAQIARLLPTRATDIALDIDLGKATKHHKTGNIFRAEINLSYASHMHRAVGVADTIERAFDVAKNELKAELRKSKTKPKALARKGGRVGKQALRGE
jgi:ribosomal subunit interface protein